MESLKLVECPRDAMQGIVEFIPTELKAKYINAILKCGFDTVDFGSFVSQKSIPQLKDTAELLGMLQLNPMSKMLAIVANERGAMDACNFEEIDYLGFPFSVSEEFQQRNTNSSIEESLVRVESIQNLAIKHRKTTVVYLSMGFGNPYGEEWNTDIVIKWSERLYNEFGINIHALSDTIGSATPATVEYLFNALIPALPKVEFGAHLHTRRENAESVLNAAYIAGCRRFDGALKGYGGCPMATDSLTGNMPTEMIIEWLEQNNVMLPIKKEALQEAMNISESVFSYH